MRRRQFIGLVGGAAVTWPLAGLAQQPVRLPRIGFLGASSASAQAKWTTAFVQRLSELGWIEGRTVGIEYRWAEGREDRLGELVAEFVRLKVSVIVTQGTAPVLAAKQATSVIPIVFASAGDPVGAGLVASLAQPGGNVTGLSSQMSDTATKRIEFLREILPGFHRLVIVANVDNPFVVLEMNEVQASTRKLGIEVATVEIQRGEDIAPAFEALKGRTDALDVITDPLMNANRVSINASALASQLPTMYGSREFAEAGGLIFYGANFADQFRRAAELTDKILRGAKPGELPVEQPTKFELVINLSTAKALGLTIPPPLLASADEVIERSCHFSSWHETDQPGRSDSPSGLPLTPNGQSVRFRRQFARARSHRLHESDRLLVRHRPYREGHDATAGIHSIGVRYLCRLLIAFKIGARPDRAKAPPDHLAVHVSPTNWKGGPKF